ncbi:MAG: hypothetical protein U0K95_04700 [Eubacterium sp.]|nr:hypothetical protein [Eubacterium sp.]
MIEFSELFIEAKGEPIEYMGETLYMSDEIKVKENFVATIELISTNSNYRQGVRIYTDGIIDSGDGAISKQQIFWEELWTQMKLGPIEIKGKSKNGIFMIWNCCQRDGCIEDWVCNCAMKKEVISKNEYIYHCNDWQWDEDFDDIVFRVKILEGLDE